MNEEIKVSELDLASEIRDTDQIMIVQGGANKKALGENINKHGVIVSPTTPETTQPVWFKHSKNIFDGVMSQGSIDNNTGDIVFTTLWAIASLNLIPVQPETTYTFSCVSTKTSKIDRIAYFDVTKTFISRSASLAVTTFTTPANTYYIRFSMLPEDGTDTIAPSDVSNLQIEEGLTSTAYEPFTMNNIKIKNKNFDETIGIGSNIDNKHRINFVKSKNLFIPTLYSEGVPITIHDASVTLNDDEYTFSATGSDLYFGQVANADLSYEANKGVLYDVKPGEIINCLLTNSDFNVIIITKYTKYKVSLGYSVIFGSSGTLDIPDNCYFVTIRIGKNNAVSGTTYKTKIMMTKTTGTINYEKYFLPGIYLDDEKIYTQDKNQWEKLTLTSNFKAYASNNNYTPRIKKEGNVVTICGIVSPTVDLADQGNLNIICNIPEKYRPVGMPMYQLCQASGSNKWILSVEVNGNVTMSRFGVGTYITATAGIWLPFTITYLV